MRTIIMGGKEYGARCDLNVLERIAERYGSMTELQEEIGSIKAIKFLACEMINEDNYARGEKERITENFVGATLTMAEFADAAEAVMVCLQDCLQPKNAYSGMGIRAGRLTHWTGTGWTPCSPSCPAIVLWRGHWATRKQRRACGRRRRSWPRRTSMRGTKQRRRMILRLQ